MPKAIFIVSGISGSGKSTFTKKVVADTVAAGKKACVVSADNYFTSTDGTYNFNPAMLGNAHGACFKAFIEALQESSTDVVIVDNTNTTMLEIMPYYQAARAFQPDATITITTVYCDAAIAAARNQHNVPEKTIQRQAKNLNERIFPSYLEHVKYIDLCSTDINNL